MTAMRKTMLAGCVSLVVAAGIGVSAPAAVAADTGTGGRIYSRPEFPYYTDVYNMRFLADAIMPKAAMAKLTPKQRNALRFGPTSAASAQACYDKWKFVADPGPGPVTLPWYSIRCNFEEVTVGEYLQTVGAATGAFISTGFESVAGSLGRIAGSL